VPSQLEGGVHGAVGNSTGQGGGGGVPRVYQVVPYTSLYTPPVHHPGYTSLYTFSAMYTGWLSMQSQITALRGAVAERVVTDTTVTVTDITVTFW